MTEKSNQTTDKETGDAALAFYRAVMDGVRLKDVIGDLNRLEGLLQKRAGIFHACQKGREFTAKEQVEMFAALETDEQAIVKRLKILQEKLRCVIKQ